MRTNLFFKVEIEHDSDEELQALATQITRQIQKVYNVRSAELSAATSEE
jgi:hypothetical protein